MLTNSLAAALGVAVLTPAAASTISVNIVGGAGGNGTLAPTDLAGASPAINWNNVNNTAGVDNTGTSLFDADGVVTTVSISWTMIGTWAIDTGTSTPDQVLYNGYLDNFGDTRTVSLTGLDPATTYEVYVYSDGDNGDNTRTGFFSMGGVTTGITDVPGNFSGSYVEVAPGATTAGNYTVFTVSGSSSYDLDFQGSAADDLPRAALNGIQIVPVPEVSTSLISLLGMVTLTLRRKRSSES